VAVISNVHEASCLNLLNFFKSVKPLVNVIIVTQNGSEDFAVAAFREGATDYFSAPFDGKDLEKRIRCLLSSEEVKNRRMADYGLDNFRDAVNYISDHYCSKIELACMANIAGMSVSCFQRAFKKRMGINFTAYVNNLRISRAKKMLENYNLSIGEIAYSNGFSNQYHFTRTFKKITNISPRLYRNSLKQ
jgi:YesN/AraC family two-component response regulator